MAEMARK